MFRGHRRTAKSQLGTEIQGINFADHTGQLKLGDKAFLTWLGDLIYWDLRNNWVESNISCFGTLCITGL